MRKLFVFILFLTTITVVIVAEVLVYQYLETPYSFDFKASIFNMPSGSTPAETGGSAAATTTASQQKNLPVTISQENIPVSPLRISLLQQAGFKNVSLKTVDFSGLLFDQVDIKDTLDLPVIHQNIVDTKDKNTGSVYIFETKSKELANEIYAILKKKLGAQSIGIFNETNTFGEASFYLNMFRFSEFVFLVVKKNRNVYALTYIKEQHELIKNLFLLLP